MTKSGNVLLDKHFQEVGTWPLPTKEEEFNLFTAYRKARTRAELSPRVSERQAATKEYQALAKKIACGYLRFVIRQARRKSHDDWLFADLISAGYEGLLHAITLFEPERGFKFLTYANNWIRVRMQECLHRVRVVNIPSHTRKEMRRMRAAAAQRAPGDAPLHGYDEPVMSSIDNVVVVDERVDVEKEAAERMVDALGLLLRAGLRRVDRLILIYTFGLRGGDPKSPEEIGQILYEIDGSQMTGERVTALTEQALKKLRDHLSDEQIRDLADILVR